MRAWLDAHPRFHLHFTPTGASWLNLVERWFAEITRKRIRRGTFRSVAALIRVIRAYLREHNQDPKPSSGAPPLPASCARSLIVKKR